METLLQRSDRACGRLLASRSGIILRLLVFMVGSLVCGWISVRLGAFDTWDLRNYQYYLPFALLEDRFTFDAAVAQIQTFLNPAPFLPFYWTTISLPPVGAGFAMGAIHGLSIGFAFLISLKLLDDLAPTARLLASLACTAIGAAGPTFVPMLGGSGSDHIVAVVVLAGIWMLLHGIRSRRWMIAGALVIGAAAGLKLTALVFVVAGLVAVPLAGEKRAWRGTALFAVASVAGLLISRGGWMAFLWSRYESPLFPFFNHWFRSPWFHQSDFADTRFLPDSFGEALIYPFLFMGSNDFTTLSHGFRDGRYAMVYLLLLVVVVLTIVRRFRTPGSSPVTWLPESHRFVLIFAVVAFAIWQAKFAIMRYILPLEFVAPALIVVLIRHQLPGGRVQAVAAVVLLALIAGTVQMRTVPRREWAEQYLQVAAPRFEDPGSVLVVIANDRPWSYLVPFFQPEVRFLGVWNRFSRDEGGQRHRAAQEMDALMDAHEGEIYLLTSGSRREAALAHLPRYTPVRGAKSRPRIDSVHERESLYLWKLVAK